MRRPRTFIGPQAMGGTVALWGASSFIKSVQRGTMTGAYPTDATATISAVDTANSIVVWLGVQQTNVNTNFAVAIGSLELTNSTTVTGKQSPSGGVNMTFSYEVIEFYPGILKSKQTGTVSVGGSASATATVTSVNTAKSQLAFQGYRIGTSAGPTTDAYATTLVLTNGTTITAARNTADGANTITAYFQLVEFF